MYNIRVRYSQLDKKICVYRYVFDGLVVVNKQCLDRNCNWVDISESSGFLWDEGIVFMTDNLSTGDPSYE